MVNFVNTMRIHYRLSDVDMAGELHLAIGMFDGVHLGHQTVIDAAIHSARRCGGFCGVLTFWPHPSVLFRPENPTPQIMNPEMKAGILRGLGIDFMIQQRFDRDYAATPAEAFLTVLLEHLPRLSSVYVGENWRFGRGRAGDVALLVKEGVRRGVSVVSVPRLHHNGDAISSTRIRECLTTGNMKTANALLGYTYFSRGPVRPGKQLGRTLGFPTLNISWAPGLQPARGVYAVRVRREGDSGFRPGVANYGVRPTVEADAEPLLEIHLLDTMEGNCPLGEGDLLTTEWLEFIRPEKKFATVEALRAQIARDREKAAAFFELTAGSVR